jgi:hypothetical protein
MLQSTCPAALVAMAQLNVLLVRGLDVSVGSLMSLTVVAASFLIASDVSVPMMVVGTLTCLLTGAVVGFVNGFLVRYAKVNAIITTIAMLSVLQGFALIGRPTPDGAIDSSFTELLKSHFGFLPIATGVGVYAHNWIHDEGSPVDLSGELLSSPIGYANNIGGPWFSWFFNPRINIGAMINTGGKTSYGFTGLTWRIPLYKGFFFEGEFGAAVNTSPLRDEPNRVNTGCRWDFRESGGFGYQFNEHWDVIANVEHISHASLCTSTNPGLTQVGARIGYKF